MIDKNTDVLDVPRSGTAHTFHIPVMGTGFTIDTPLHVARYGISSVISLVDDLLIEQIRKYYAEKYHEPYEAITDKDENSRARRITAYLNLLDSLVDRQIVALQASPFEKGSEITRYYELLPETSLKRAYRDMLVATDPIEKKAMQDKLRRLAVPGSIDVNIMAKGDRDLYEKGEKLSSEFSDAMAALRGFASSTLGSSIIFSAGMNPRLYSYIAKFDDFFPNENGYLKKKIVLKVSDYRSAVIQGKYLAKRGLWVSEFRIESGLNCGGHAFATNGYLMGPILEELKQNKQELIETLHAIYIKSIPELFRSRVKEPFGVRVTVQGGIGTADEDKFLTKYYNVDGTGWGTPFLLVPEVTNLDEAHLKKLVDVTESDNEVYLSVSSPFGMPFWNLRSSGSEKARENRIRDGKPGILCTKGHVRFNTEFTKVPICAASNTYQKLKLAAIEKEGLSDEQLKAAKDNVLARSCICHDLGGAVSIKLGIDPNAAPAICCGPGIVNFSKIATLEEMVDHIYGRRSLLTNPDRVHMFIKELMLYIDYLRKELQQFSLNLSVRTPKYFHEIKENLFSGIEYYKRLASHFVGEQKTRFLSDLKDVNEKIELIAKLPVFETCPQNGRA